MTAPDPKDVAELAWEIHDWFSERAENDDEWFSGFSKANAKALATFLTEKGYHNGEKGLRASLKYLEDIGAKLADEFVPVYDALSKRYKDEGRHNL